MGALILTNAKIVYGGRDLSGILNQISLGGETDLQEDTAMGNVGNYRTRIAGLLTSMMEINGYWESTSAGDSADKDLFEKIGASKELVSASAEGGSVGDVGYSLEVDAANYTPGASLGEVFAFSLSAQGNGPLLRGTVLENSTRGTTGDGTAFQLGQVGATQKIYSAIHVTATSGTPSLTVVLQSDTAENMAGATPRITHAVLTDVGSELLSLAGVITDNWWQLEMTISGGSPSLDIFGVVAIF